MAVTAHIYPKGQQHIQAGDTNVISDTIKCALILSTYTPSDTHEFFATSVDAYEAAGTGYTAGGQTLTSKTVTTTLANSWATPWAATTAYAAGDVIRPTTGNGHVYVCQTAGTSAGAEPSWPTADYGQVADNTAVWVEAGGAVIKFDSGDLSWSSSTIPSSRPPDVRYAVFYRVGTAGVSDYLISYLDFGQDEHTVADTFGITIAQAGITQGFTDA